MNSAGKQITGMKAVDTLTRINQGFAKGIMTSDIGDRRLLDDSDLKEVIGSGMLLGDSEIKPKETLSTQYILPVPKGEYDFVQIRVYVPTLNQDASKRKNIKAPLKIVSQEKGYKPELMFCVAPQEQCNDLNVLNKKQENSLGAQIHSSVSESWLGKSKGT